MNLEKIAANKTARQLGVLYFVLSAITSFAFFYVNLPSFLPLPPIGGWESFLEPVISGLIGVALFTYATVRWLKIYLHGCDNNEQRSIANTAFWATFWADAAASFAYIFLSGNALLTLPQDLYWWISLISIFMVASAVVFNFYSYVQFNASSNISKQAIREAERQGKIQQVEEEAADYLDDLVQQGVRERLGAKAQEIANAQADRIAGERARIELAKGKNDQAPPPQRPSSPSQPKPIFKSRTQRPGASGQPAIPRARQKKGFFVQLHEPDDDGQLVWQKTTNIPFSTIDEADIEIDKYPGISRRIVNLRGETVLRDRTTNGNGAGPYKPGPFE